MQIVGQSNDETARHVGDETIGKSRGNTCNAGQQIGEDQDRPSAVRVGYEAEDERSDDCSGEEHGLSEVGAPVVITHPV